MGLRKVSYTDSDGRKHMALLPAEIPDTEAEKGVPLGPPPLEGLNLPNEIEIRLHNELFHRGIFTPKDALLRRSEIVSALQAALKVDAGKIVDLYIGSDYKVARTERMLEPVLNGASNSRNRRPARRPKS